MPEDPKDLWQTVHGVVFGSGVPIRVEEFSHGIIITVTMDTFNTDNAYAMQEFQVTPDYDLEENIDRVEDTFCDLVDEVRREQAKYQGGGRSLN